MIPVKNERELEVMRRACKMTAAARALAGDMVRPGVTTRQIDKAVHDYIVSQGAKPTFLGYGGFPASTCISVNEVVIHGIPGGRRLKEGDTVLLGRTEDGSQGIYINSDPFASKESASLNFSFRKGRTRETGFSRDYREIVELLRYERENGGCCVWVLGPAFTFDDMARDAFCRIVRAGYVQALLAGNALATHDLEGSYLHTALGADITTQKAQPNGHYNHLDTLNKVSAYGSIPAFLEGEGITDGIMAACVQTGVPFVLVGSVRDDGPLPEVFRDVYAGQDAMRQHVKKATTVIGMATTLHTIATGNMTPSFRVLEDGTIRPVYFYSVDTSDFSANKLADRGSLSAKGIVANAQDFITKVAAALGL